MLPPWECAFLPHPHFHPLHLNQSSPASAPFAAMPSCQGKVRSVEKNQSRNVLFGGNWFRCWMVGVTMFAKGSRPNGYLRRGGGAGSITDQHSANPRLSSGVCFLRQFSLIDIRVVMLWS